jgi:hypothetical protein
VVDASVTGVPSNRALFDKAGATIAVEDLIAVATMLVSLANPTDTVRVARLAACPAEAEVIPDGIVTVQVVSAAN